jgi:hypothetical protein
MLRKITINFPYQKYKREYYPFILLLSAGTLITPFPDPAEAGQAFPQGEETERG